MTGIPSLNWVRAFAAAAKTGSFAAAAVQLNVTQPAISKQIRLLEAYFGQQLFARGPQSVSLTPAGKAFASVVQQSLATLETASATIFGNRSQQTVRLHAPNLFACSWIAERYWQFAADFPDIRLEVAAGTVPEGERSDADTVHVRYGSRSGAKEHFLFGETLYPVAGADLAGTISSVRDIVPHRLLEVGANRAGWITFFECHKPDLAGSARLAFVGSTPIALAIASAGHGLALARAPASDFLIHQYGLVRCCSTAEIPSKQGYYLSSPPAAPLSPAATKLWEWLAAHAR